MNRGVKGKYQAVYIEWIDSVMKLPVWHSTGDLFETTKEISSIMQTVGYLVNQNKHEYILTGSIHFDGGQAVQFGQVFTIPKGCVTKLIKLKINPKP